MTQSFAITHPSQPNYVALFSGSVNGITDDSCPQALSGDNLASSLTAAGLSFTTYSEDLPSVGYTGCTSGNYARKHNPAVDFPAVPATANQPLTALPADYSTLPTVSYVVPNLQHDMHDGTIAQADSWVQSTMKPYVTWAGQHNSLLVVTWDEDDYGSNNQIPTFVVGAGVVPGAYPEHINHYNVLRTIEDAYGLTPIGASATAAPILDIWAPPAGGPHAAFSVSCTGLTCTADGRSSSGGAGAVTGYRWNWGDGSATTTGATASHTFAAGGTFQVSLTVTNDAQLTDSATQTVTPSPPVDANLIAADAFGRTVTNGFGTADVGGAWTVTGTAARFGVAAGVASMNLAAAGTSLTAMLNHATGTDTDLRLSVSTDKIADNNGTYIRLVGRHVSANNEYQATVRIAGSGVPALSIGAEKNSATIVTLSTAPPVPGLVLTAGAVLNTRFQVTGTNPTTLRLKVWAAGTAEPTAWQTTATDSFAALQAPGSIGVAPYLSSGSTNAPVVLRLANLSARTTAAMNAPPVAAATVSCADLTCTANGASSTDPDGSIASYAWNWGDGSAATTGSTSTHTYATAGSYPVGLTVTDNGGATGTFATTATPTRPAGQPPVALLTVNCTNLVCNADGTASSDPDGTIAGYAWSWSDGSPDGSGPTPTHAYGAAGTYLVTLTVTDDSGSTNSASVSVTVTLAPNVDPTASLTVTCAALLCTADSSGSTDPDGTVAGYSWDWGDGSAPTTGITSTHTYAAAGSFPVTLTVTDNRGGTGTAAQTATPTAPADTSFARDTFARTVANGWGTADVGGAWTVAGGNPNFSVGGGAGSVVIPKAGTTVSAFLPGTARTSADFLASVSTDKLATNNGTYYTFVGRHVGTNLEYEGRARVAGTGAVVLSIGALTGTSAAVTFGAQVTVPGLNIPAGSTLVSRLQVTGTNPDHHPDQGVGSRYHGTSHLAAQRNRSHPGPADGGIDRPAGVPVERVDQCPGHGATEQSVGPAGGALRAGKWRRPGGPAVSRRSSEPWRAAGSGWRARRWPRQPPTAPLRGRGSPPAPRAPR